MSGSHSARVTRVASIVLVAATVIGVAAARAPILRTAGWALVAGDSVEPADVIVVTAAGPGASILEAAELVNGGIAARVAVFADPPDNVDREFTRRGIPHEEGASSSVRQLRSLGIKTVEQIPKSVAGTEEEARMLPDWCRQRHIRSVVVISTADHSRRLRRAFGRAMQGYNTKVAVRVTRYSQFDPDTWWQTRDGTRTAVVELQKLLLDLALHPFS